jgi:hypothetical protein
LNNGLAVDFEGEKKAFADFLTQTKTDPNAIDYDPNYVTNIDVVFDKTGLHFQGGWIDDLFANVAATLPKATKSE